MLIWAVICSIFLHVLFFVVVPNLKFDAIKKIPDVLKVEIVQPKKPEPVVIPEPPKPLEPIKKASEPIKPLPKNLPKPKLESIPEAKPEPVHHEPPPLPAVITAAPKVDAPVEFKAPPPEPPKNIGPSDEEISTARDSYKQKVVDELIRNHRYPKIAQQRGAQGTVKVKITLDKEGNVTDVSVVESSGNSLLDDGAIATVKRSNLKQLYPEILHGRDYFFITPIKFTLE